MLGGRGEIPSGKMFALTYASPLMFMAVLGLTIWFFNNKKWRDF